MQLFVGIQIVFLAMQLIQLHLVNLMDTGKLQSIITNQQIFWNTPMDKFMLALLCGQAKAGERQ